MKRFIYKTLLMTLPLLLLIAAVNYTGDAARLFDDTYEKKLAKMIKEGHYVTNIDNYDERKLQQELILNLNSHPEQVIIGSSRTMLINSGYFPGQTFFNSSVSGASIEDLISIYQLYKENNKLPEKILIGIDPWTFNENNEQVRWMSIKSAYERFEGKKISSVSSINKYQELFSLSYFQSSLKKLPKVLSGKTEPIPTTEKYNVSYTKLTDGALVYERAVRNASPVQIEEKMRSYMNDPLYGIKNFNMVSKRIWLDFEKLIADIQRNKVEVAFFLAPYPPMVYQKVKADYPKVIEAEEKVRNFATAKHIQVYGSFNPFVLHMDESYFYDGMHCKENGLHKILDDQNY